MNSVDPKWQSLSPLTRSRIRSSLHPSTKSLFHHYCFSLLWELQVFGYPTCLQDYSAVTLIIFAFCFYEHFTWFYIDLKKAYVNSANNLSVLRGATIVSDLLLPNIFTVVCAISQDIFSYMYVYCSNQLSFLFVFHIHNLRQITTDLIFLPRLPLTC